MKTRKQLQTDSNIRVAIGFLGAVGCRLAILAVREDSLLLWPLLIANFGFVAVFILGCADYAQSKGYSRWWGLLGLISCVGLLMLMLMPNRWVEPNRQEDWPTNYPRP